MIEYDRSYNIIELAYIPEEVENEVVSEYGEVSSFEKGSKDNLFYTFIKSIKYL